MAIILVSGCGLLLGKLADLFLPATYRDARVEGPLIRCSDCQRRATLFDAVPLAETALRGRCPQCGSPIPIRWLLLPVATAVLGAICYLEFGSVGEALVGTLFAGILLTLVFTDLERRVLPDRIVLPSIIAAAGLAWSLPGNTLIGSGYGAIVALIVAAIMVIGSLPFGRSAFGMGDAKLILLLGVLLGPRDVLVAVLLAFVAAGVVAGALLISRQRDRGSYLPLGPFLAIGGIAAMLWGGEIWDWWVE